MSLVTKKAVTAKTLSTYMSHVNAWYSEVAEQPLGVTTQRKPKKLLAELTKALPQSNCQKNGFTADDMRGMLDSVQADGGSNVQCGQRCSNSRGSVYCDQASASLQVHLMLRSTQPDLTSASIARGSECTLQ